MVGIDAKQHAQLLYYLNELPYEDAAELRTALQATYAAFVHEVANYMTLERVIRARIAEKEIK